MADLNAKQVEPATIFRLADQRDSGETQEARRIARSGKTLDEGVLDEIGVGFALVGAMLSMLRLSSAGSRGAERVRVQEGQRLKGE